MRHALRIIVLTSSTLFSQFLFADNSDLINSYRSELKTKYMQLMQKNIGFQCEVQTTSTQQNSKLIERSPDNTAVFSTDSQVRVNSDGTTSPLVVYGGKLSESGTIYVNSHAKIDNIYSGNTILSKQINDFADKPIVTSTWLKDSSGTVQVLVESKNKQDGSVTRNGSRNYGMNSLPYIPRFQDVYRLADFPGSADLQVISLNPDQDKIVYKYSDEKGSGSIEYTIEKSKGNAISLLEQNDFDRKIVKRYDNLVKVGEYYLPQTITEEHLDKDGKLIQQKLITDCHYKLLTKDEAEKKLKIDFPSDTVFGQKGLKIPLPGIK